MAEACSQARTDEESVCLFPTNCTLQVFKYTMPISFDTALLRARLYVFFESGGTVHVSLGRYVNDDPKLDASICLPTSTSYAADGSFTRLTARLWALLRNPP